jgi:hypothetical protein
MQRARALRISMQLLNEDGISLSRQHKLAIASADKMEERKMERQLSSNEWLGAHSLRLPPILLHLYTTFTLVALIFLRSLDSMQV